MAKNDDALNEFIAKRNRILALTTRIQKAGDNFFDTLPEDVTWADVGDLGHLETLLQRATDFAFQEGENAN